MEPARGRTASAEGADAYLKDLDTVQLLLPPGDGDGDGDSASPELAMEASSSYPCIDQGQDQHLANYWLVLPSTPELGIDGSSSPDIDWAALDKIPLYTDTYLEVATTIFPSDAMVSDGAMRGSDLNEPLRRDNTCLQVATMASSPYASPPTFPSDATTNSGLGAPAKYTHPVVPRHYSPQKEEEAVTHLLDMRSIIQRLLKSLISYATEEIYLRLTTWLTTYLWPKKKQTITHVSSIPRTKFNSGAPVKYTHHVVPRRCSAQKVVEAVGPLDGLVIDLASIIEHALMPMISDMIDDIIQHATYYPKEKQTITHVPGIPHIKFNIDFYEEAIGEILHVLRAACVIHKLPLAQAWATCAQQGKQYKHHSYENCRYCISTIDAACYVHDPRIQFFHEACSEHHLLPGQGVAGKAFATNQSCFLPDVGSSTEQEYPLSHHAKIFKLKGVMAIPLRSIRTGTADFVLEFFLPTDCELENEQNALLNSLSGTVQYLCRTLRMVTNKEMEDDPAWEMNEINSLGLQKNNKVKKRKSMARRSPVWKSFTEVMVRDTVKAKCNHCGIDLCCDPKTHGTSSLTKHLKICKFNPKRITGPI